MNANPQNYPDAYVLTQAQREAWNVTGPKVQSKKRLT